MSPCAANLIVGGIGIIHVGIMGLELYPWTRPIAMSGVLKTKKIEPSPDDAELIATIVHNSGIYNGVVAAGLIASAWCESSARGVQIALLSGVIVAGLFGARTLGMKVIVQAIIGAIGLVAVLIAK